ncbi:hypothetical protein [Peribacillus frigoritolerans]|uniref:hypothetical protein n=1 Tax=Peribacillus frigoritolerans TaxID=450367 RepID=UPI002079C795|nr:hypothetical protein [Peribacillus frigoritolerans]USK66294.1 hypothetical protein LIT26_06595 [Peribacillus frigoritolerans]
MKIKLSQMIQLEDFRKGSISINKTFDSNILPRIGDRILDSVWKYDDQEIFVETVEINYQDNECYIGLTKITLNTLEKHSLKDYKDMTALHGWECASPIW